METHQSLESGGKLKVIDLGVIEYSNARLLQSELAEKRRDGLIPDTFLLLEHPPTITLGRRGKRSDILASDDELVRQGVVVVETDRGGEVTYHGPGQLVCYPILDLSKAPHQPDLHAYLRRLEETIIVVLASLQLDAARFSPHTGVWVGMPEKPRKIAAIGLRLSRWITQHGFALNVNPCMKHFDLIVPCGIREYPVTSLFQETQREYDMSVVKERVVTAFHEIFELGE